MGQTIEFDLIEDALRRCGSTWEVAQMHGLLCSRLATEGAAAGAGWLAQVLEGVDETGAPRQECESLLDAIYGSSYRQLAERQSDFELLLPDDQSTVQQRTAALAQWCDGFLHGLVSGQRDDAVREKLSTEPLADIIKDMLQITRASVDEEDDEEANEEAYSELVEFIRVGAQLAYEELAELRDEPPAERATVQQLH